MHRKSVSKIQEIKHVSKAILETVTKRQANVPAGSESDAMDSTYHSSFLVFLHR